MPFGLCNAPATFQSMMNGILHDYVDRFALVYLDDIIIYSQDWQEHKRHVHAVVGKAPRTPSNPDER